ncbi:alanine--tRNA ligase-related protein, partial [Shewanella sp. A25]|nr:alanine--tRNA ligase-related protein [Shewanella shenzhenensis]
YELTEESAADAGLTVDRAGFDAEMTAQQERARAARGNTASMGVQNALLTDLKTESTYVGWSELTVDAAKLTDLIVDNELVESAKDGQAEVIF